MPQLGVKHPPAPPGILGRIVGGPQNIGNVVEIIENGALAERMVAQGDHIRPGVQHILRLLGRQTHIGGIFAVDHRKRRLIFFP